MSLKDPIYLELLRSTLRWVLRRIYRVRVVGLEHYAAAPKPALIVANHASFLDPILLTAFLPEKPIFAIDVGMAAKWWLRPFGRLVELFPMDAENPMAIKSLITYMKTGRNAVIFPEGRITVTGSLMKIYEGPGLVADRAGAVLLPMRVDGPQYSPFSRLQGRFRLRWFPQVKLTMLPARRFDIPPGAGGRVRRKLIGRALCDIMTETMFAAAQYRQTIPEAICDARAVHGGSHTVVEDPSGKPLSYNGLVQRASIMGGLIARETDTGEYVGLLLPNSSVAVVVLMALLFRRRVPALLNFTAGSQGMLDAVAAAGVNTVYTSRLFIAKAGLGSALEALTQKARIVFLEDLAARVGVSDKLRGFVAARPGRRMGYYGKPDDPAVILFTSGSEGTPKGVVLSHTNLLANIHQLGARVDFSPRDVILNVLPMFHCFGMTAGTLLPLVSGMKVFHYPSPLHYRVVPELCYEINATILFGTNTFLAGYARHAHPYDFYSIRYVFAGAEPLRESTRRTWAERFGVRIFEGYGTTETGPVLAVNTPMDSRAGSVGRLLPGIQHRIEPVAGIGHGGRLWVRGANVMLGYLRGDRPGELAAPSAGCDPGWYDTGDVVHGDEDGFLWIRGRVKRFAKVGGEMVSLLAVENLANRVWPEGNHAAIALPDAQKGEQVVLLTECKKAQRREFLARARDEGYVEMMVPRRIIIVDAIPVLGSGKADYGMVRAMAERELS